MKSEEQVRAALEVLGAVGTGKVEQQAAALRWVLGEDPVAKVMESAAEAEQLRAELDRLKTTPRGVEEVLRAERSAAFDQVKNERDEARRKLGVR